MAISDPIKSALLVNSDRAGSLSTGLRVGSADVSRFALVTLGQEKASFADYCLVDSEVVLPEKRRTEKHEPVELIQSRKPATREKRLRHSPSGSALASCKSKADRSSGSPTGLTSGA